MKFAFLATIAAIGSFLISFSTAIYKVPKASEVFFRKNLPVGTIISSVVEYPEFKEIVGDNWVPADGGDVPRVSKYYETTRKKKLPDLRGMFLRGLNQFEGNNPRNDGKEDPDGIRKAGAYQADSTKKPNNDFVTDDTGSHSHDIPKGGGENDAGVWTDTGERAGRGNPVRTVSSGNHSHVVSGGDAETRPKNVAVFYYIKIN